MGLAAGVENAEGKVRAEQEYAITADNATCGNAGHGNHNTVKDDEGDKHGGDNEVEEKKLPSWQAALWATRGHAGLQPPHAAARDAP